MCHDLLAWFLFPRTRGEANCYLPTVISVGTSLAIPKIAKVLSPSKQTTGRVDVQPGLLGLTNH